MYKRISISGYYPGCIQYADKVKASIFCTDQFIVAISTSTHHYILPFILL